MKRIFTLFFVLGTVAGAHAQSSRSYPDGRYENRDVVLGQRTENSRYASSMSVRERDRQIDRINREYDRRIRQVENDRRMRSYERSGELRRLDEQRRQEIRLVWERFRSSNTAYNDRSARDNRRW